MLLHHLAKLELLSRLQLKTSTLTPVVLWIALLGVRKKILLTCVLLHAAYVTISLTIIVWSGFKLFSKRPLHDVSWILVTRSCLMTTGLKVIGLIDNFWIPLVMWVCTLVSLLGWTCSLESLIVSNWLSEIFVDCWYILLLYKILKISIHCDFITTFKLCFRFFRYFIDCLLKLLIGQQCTAAIIVIY